jgi:TRAP-type transport system small permease protein
VKFSSFISQIIHKINKICIYISLFTLLIMVLFVACDVIGRYIFNKPILGGMEIQELMMVLIVFLALGITTYDKQHVYVELLIARIKGRSLTIMNSVTTLLSFTFVVLVLWQTFKAGISDLTSEAPTITPSLSIPVAPFVILAAVGLTLMALEFFLELVNNLKLSVQNQKSIRKGQEGQHG